MLNEALILLASYLIGSIPFGMIISSLAGYGDIRKIGSGNIGATNVLRTGNKLIAFLTLLADGGKVIVAILLAHKLGLHQDYLVGAIGIIGHLFPVWLKFEGGKGVASFFGLSLYLFPKIALFMFIAWGITFAIFRYSSLAAIIAAIAGIISLTLTQEANINTWLMVALLLLIILKHKDNIIRLLKGEELSAKSKS
jgi:glycerol-3-phosphate acyltransferase PlsY